MTATNYDWLPEHHTSVVATLAHADEVIAHAAAILFDYQSLPERVMVLKEVPMGTFSQTVVAGLGRIPRKVPLLVADALTTLRNALEHTLFAEVEHRDGPLDDRAARLIELPAAKTYQDFQEWVTKRRKHGPASLRVGSDLLRRIDGLQPFHRTIDPQDHPMALLASHTNYTKHRAPAVTAIRLAAMYRDKDLPGSIHDLPARPEIPLQVGDVLAETPRGTQVPVTMFPSIGINRPGTTRWPVLMKELDYLAQWVRTQAVPRLITGNQPPLPPLPATYDISVGHFDERSAIGKGSSTSAAELHRQRLTAATARPDLVNMIRQMRGAPSAEHIAAWLGSLSDQEVLDRMSKLKMTLTYEPHIVMHNAAVVKDMRDEALRYDGGLAG